MISSVEKLIAEIRSGLKDIYGPRLRTVYLYGSYARQEACEGSDLDILIVLDGIDSYGAEIDRTSELISKLSLAHGISVSRVFISELEWKTGKSLFLSRVREESIAA